MAKKDTYLALLRRGIDETTSMTLADAGLKIGDLKKITIETLTDNYGLKKKVAESVLSVISAEPSSQGRQRYLSKVLTSDKKKMDKIEEERFKRQQKDILAERQILVTEKIGDLGDADLAELITRLQALTLSKQASQATFSKIGQQTLFDFIR